MELARAVAWSLKFGTLGGASCLEMGSVCTMSDSMRRAERCSPTLEDLSNHWKPAGLIVKDGI